MLLLISRRLPHQLRHVHQAVWANLQQHVAAFPRRRFTAAQSILAAKKKEDDLDVNYFDEDMSSNPSRRPMSDDFEEEEVEELKARISRLEDEVKQFTLPKVMSEEVASKFFSEQELERASTLDIDKDLEDIDVLAHQVTTSAQLSHAGEIWLDYLNDSMDEASLDPSNPDARKELWRCYQRAKNNIVDLPAMIPKAGWNLLWTSQSQDDPSNPNRASHLKILSEDMLAGGHERSNEQRYAHLEGLFLEGHHDKALREWEAAAQTSDGANPEFLEAGLRMYAYKMNVTRALGLLHEIFKIDNNWNPRIILPVVSACISLQDVYGYDQAWTLYKELRNRLSNDMTMEDFDKISLGFLAAKQKDYAIAVFRDMMLCNDKPTISSKYGSGKILGRFAQLLSSSKDLADVNSTSVEALNYLPRRFQNKFFYASWLKKLIGMEELDAAAQVIELMYERNAKPDAKHLNGLISAWLRAGTGSAQKKATSMAWAMIQRRIDFTRQRSATMSGSREVRKRSVDQNDEGLEIQYEQREAPPATIETFSILVQHFLRREMFGHVRHLRNLLVEAEIPMNSYFMNHLLYAELRNRTHREAWSRFEVMSRGVKPDVETWLCLWGCMKFHVDSSQNPDPTGFPSPQELFKRMVEWYQSLKGQELRDAHDDMEVEFYNDIIRCFCLSHDMEGTFVALYAMKKIFGLYPVEVTVRMLLMQIARSNTPKPHHPRHSRTITKKSKETLALTAEILAAITEQRREMITEQGYHWDDLEEEQRAEEAHRALLQLLYTVWKRKAGPLTFFNGAIRDTALRMGVEPFDAEEAMSLALEL